MIKNLIQRTNKGYQHSRNVDSQLEYDKLTNTVEYRSTVKNCFLNGIEVVVENNYLARFLRDFRAAAHCETDVRFLECGRVVYAVAGHTYDEVEFLSDLDESALIARQSSCDHSDVRQFFLQFLVGQLADFVGRQNEIGGILDKSRLGGDSHSGIFAVTGYHNNLYARALHLLYSGDRLGTDLVSYTYDTHQGILADEFAFLDIGVAGS